MFICRRLTIGLQGMRGLAWFRADERLARWPRNLILCVAGRYPRIRTRSPLLHQYEDL